MKWHPVIAESTPLVANALHGFDVIGESLDSPPLW